MEVYPIGRGKGQATNVPERALIEQVKLRPLLYDKTVKDYRKPGVSDAAWNEVADACATPVSNCRKRWKSLRDTFIKYYRWEVQYNNGGQRRKHKPWGHYDDMTFLKPHVELFRLEDTGKDNTEISFIKESVFDGEKYVFVEEEEELKEVYEIREGNDEEYYEEDPSSRKDENLIETYEEELDENFAVLETDQIDKSDEVEEFTYEPEPEPEQHEEIEVRPEPKLPDPPEPPSQKNVVDPDERYLMSCLPAFKRFTPQQKAYVRMGIERLFYEVEFENISEPKNKKTKLS